MDAEEVEVTLEVGEEEKFRRGEEEAVGLMGGGH